MYIEKRLKELYLEVMEAFVIKEVETVEQHISLYSTRLVLWQYMKTSLRLEKLLEFLKRTFCQLFCIYYKGNKRFGSFLAAWYKEVCTLACDTLSTQNTRTLGSYLVSEYNDICCSRSLGHFLDFLTSLKFIYLKHTY